MAYQTLMDEGKLDKLLPEILEGLTHTLLALQRPQEALPWAEQMVLLPCLSARR